MIPAAPFWETLDQEIQTMQSDHTPSHIDMEQDQFRSAVLSELPNHIRKMEPSKYGFTLDEALEQSYIDGDTIEESVEWMKFSFDPRLLEDD